jgi:uncharacterized protein (TIGR02271 family)
MLFGAAPGGAAPGEEKKENLIMAKTIVGLFDDVNEAHQVVQELIDAGVDHNKISIVANDAKGEYKHYKADGSSAAEGAGAGAVGGGVLGGVLGLLVGVGALAIPGIGPVLAAGPLAAALGTAGASTLVGAGVGAATGGLIGGLVGLGIPEEDANMYAEGVRRGGTLVTAQVADNLADRAAAIMDREGIVDLDTAGSTWRQSGWKSFDANAKPYSTSEIESFRTSRPAVNEARTKTQTRDQNQAEAVLPVIEEELQVGKRQVQRGGVRVHTNIEETPVEEQVTLHSETVNVERRQVDRPISDADTTAFKEQSFELTETDEEAVVSKQARVVEEVVVNKETQDRTETVRDTVRRQDVHVHEEGAQQAVNASGYDRYDADFRRHFQTSYANSGYTYEQYGPTYRYGYNLASSERTRGKDWDAIQADARQTWEERNPGTWEQFKDSIRYAWDRARGDR